MAESTAKAPDPQTTPVPKRTVPEFRLDRIRQTEYVHNTWTAMIPHGTEPADLRTESYWAHAAHVLRKHDVIRCIWEDSWGEVTVRVLAVGHAWVKVHVDDRDVRKYPEFDHRQRTPGYKVEYVNGFAGWCVIRERDKVTLKDKLDTESDAHQWLANHLKSLASAA